MVFFYIVQFSKKLYDVCLFDAYKLKEFILSGAKFKDVYEVYQDVFIDLPCDPMGKEEIDDLLKKSWEPLAGQDPLRGPIKYTDNVYLFEHAGHEVFLISDFEFIEFVMTEYGYASAGDGSDEKVAMKEFINCFNVYLTKVNECKKVRLSTKDLLEMLNDYETMMAIAIAHTFSTTKGSRAHIKNIPMHVLRKLNDFL
jgi:hypothetical protein